MEEAIAAPKRGCVRSIPYLDSEANAAITNESVMIPPLQTCLSSTM